jgi:tetrapyrrole methylase family protein/MazG family protein
MIEPTLLAALLQAVAADLTQGYQAVPATYITQRYFPQVEVNLPVLVFAIETSSDGALLWRALRNAYPPSHPVKLVWPDAAGELQWRALTLAEYGENVAAAPPHALYLPPLPPDSSVTALQEIVAHLRSPAGCPWDRAQTLSSLRHDLLSECAEVIEAIDAQAGGGDNSQHIGEELGDLLLGIALMVQIATDDGRFQMADVVQTVVTKLRRRHPHVFGDTVVDGVERIITNWDAIKAQERAAKGQPLASPLDGVPAALPALEKAHQLQAKAAKAGLLDRAALAHGDPRLADLRAGLKDEGALGALLWQLVALAHTVGLNAEDALRAYAVQFRAIHEVGARQGQQQVG